ncbi:MAG: SRPBCC family protein [Ktedonobacteraceae bacterium]
MGFTICPAAVVAAPVESVWELLSEPTLYDVWWDACTERIVPEGKASPGQVLYAKTSGLGRKWDVTLRVEMVNPEKHQIQLHVTLPLGTVNETTLTCTAIDTASCRVQFG